MYGNDYESLLDTIMIGAGGDKKSEKAQKDIGQAQLSRVNRFLFPVFVG
jgi:hypothetical protein